MWKVYWFISKLKWNTIVCWNKNIKSSKVYNARNLCWICNVELKLRSKTHYVYQFSINKKTAVFLVLIQKTWASGEISKFRWWRKRLCQKKWKTETVFLKIKSDNSILFWGAEIIAEMIDFENLYRIKTLFLFLLRKFVLLWNKFEISYQSLWLKLFSF